MDDITSLDAVLDAVSESLGVDRDSLTEDTNPTADLKASSVDFVHITKHLEDALDMTVPFMKLRRNKTIGAMAEYLDELREE